MVLIKPRHLTSLYQKCWIENLEHKKMLSIILELIYIFRTESRGYPSHQFSQTKKLMEDFISKKHFVKSSEKKITRIIVHFIFLPSRYWNLLLFDFDFCRENFLISKKMNFETFTWNWLVSFFLTNFNLFWEIRK